MNETDSRIDKYEPFIKIFKDEHGILKLDRAIKLGIPKFAIYQMYAKGILEKEQRGLYRLASGEPLGNLDVVQVSLLVPKAVICSLSALYFHNLTTQVPDKVYISLPGNVQTPPLEYPTLDIYWLSKEAYIAGIEEYLVDEIPVRIYDREKTIADCFKFRNRIGLDTAIEALKDYVRQPKPRMDKIFEYARIDRVEEVIKPYIRTIVS